MRTPARGEIWSADFDPVQGHEQGGRRPCLIISDDLYNSGASQKHLVLPITSRGKGVPFHVEVAPPEGGLRTRSFVLCDDIRSVSRLRLTNRLGAAADGTVNAVMQRLKMLIGIS